MNPYRIIVLGASGSGKTVYLASMYKRLGIQRDDTGFFFDVEPEQQKILVQKFKQIASPGAWPAGTKPTEVSEWNFTCMVQRPGDLQNFPALKFIYLDYAGERLTDPQGGTSQDDFDIKIKNADALLGILDGQKILALMRKEAEGYDFVNGDLAIILQDMQRSQNPVHFVITKWDLLEKKYSLRQVRERLLEVDDFREFVQNRIRRCMVRLIPVSSVGTGFAELQPNGSMRKIPGAFPKPFQVEVPLACVLPDKFKAQVDKLREEEEKLRGMVVASNPNLTFWDHFGMNVGGAVRFLRGFLTGGYQFEDVLLGSLLKFVESGTKKKQEEAAREAEHLRRQREESLQAVRNEQTAIDHSITSFMVLVRELERKFPESDFLR